MKSVRPRGRIPGFVRVPGLLTLLVIQIVYLTAKGTAQGTRDLARSAYKGTQKRIRRTRRRRTNKYAATHDVATRISMPRVTEQNQLDSYFLKLPLELRQQIYNLHFQQATIFISELNEDGYRLSAAMKMPRQMPALGNRNCFHPPIPFVRRPIPLLHLPLVCRQIYGETIEYVYKTNTFRLGYHRLASLLPTLAIFPQKHLDSLTSLHFEFSIDALVKDIGLGPSHPNPDSEQTVTSWIANSLGKRRQRRKWAALWTFLVSLPKLEKLHVKFIRFHTRHMFSDQRAFWSIVAPLLQFEIRKPLASFGVEWQVGMKNWYDSEDWRPPESWKNTAPFHLTWK